MFSFIFTGDVLELQIKYDNREVENCKVLRDSSLLTFLHRISDVFEDPSLVERIASIHQIHGQDPHYIYKYDDPDVDLTKKIRGLNITSDVIVIIAKNPTSELYILDVYVHSFIQFLGL